MFDMDVGGADGDGNCIDTAFYGFPDVSNNRTVPGHNAGLKAHADYFLNAVLFKSSHYRYSGFNLIDAYLVKVTGDSDFLRIGKDHPGSLFTIP